MISFDKDKRVFHITNESISYYIYINSVGHLETLYFGEYLKEIDDIGKNGRVVIKLALGKDKEHNKNSIITLMK